MKGWGEDNDRVPGAQGCLTHSRSRSGEVSVACTRPAQPPPTPRHAPPWNRGCRCRWSACQACGPSSGLTTSRTCWSCAGRRRCRGTLRAWARACPKSERACGARGLPPPLASAFSAYKTARAVGVGCHTSCDKAHNCRNGPENPSETASKHPACCEEVLQGPLPRSPGGQATCLPSRKKFSLAPQAGKPPAFQASITYLKQEVPPRTPSLRPTSRLVSQVLLLPPHPGAARPAGGAGG